MGLDSLSERVMSLSSIALTLLLLGCGDEQEPHVMLEMGCEQCGKGQVVQEGCQQCMIMADNALGQNRPDIGKARQLYNKGCGVHHPESCSKLAAMVSEGRGGPPDLKRANDLYGIACEKGSMQSACTEWALSMYDGASMKQDQERAVALFDTACTHEEQAQPKACAALGLAYFEGVGVERRDQEKGVELLKASCTDNFAPGCVQTALAHLGWSRGSRRANVEIAEEAFERACKVDPQHGCFELAELHEDNKAIDSSPEKAAIFYQKTCNIDPTRGCFEAAELMAEGKVEARNSEIASLYNLACEHGHSEACSKRSKFIEP